jgi:hypothetical protein
MQPSELTAASFASYQAKARAFAVTNLTVLQQLPLALVPLLLREVIAYDVRFPAEQRMLDDQFAYLASLSRKERDVLLHGFVSIKVTEKLADMDWVHQPQQFSEALTAHLWATHQMDAFRSAADEYAVAWRKAKPDPDPALPRLSIVLIGQECSSSPHPLFRKLRPYGVYFPNMDPANGWNAIAAAVRARSSKHPEKYQHWYIDGGEAVDLQAGEVSVVSYAGLAPVRSAILKRMQSVINSGSGGPEALRTLLAQTRPEDIGLDVKNDVTLAHFKASILTEGSGTQIFSTTFAQWTAREALRRAQPVTVLLRFAPRQRQLPMNELLSGQHPTNETDPIGSLIDADMGAYYTWINQQRLSGADKSCFLAWFEGKSEVVAIGPSLPRGAVSPSQMTMEKLIDMLG